MQGLVERSGERFLSQRFAFVAGPPGGAVRFYLRSLHLSSGLPQYSRADLAAYITAHASFHSIQHAFHLTADESLLNLIPLGRLMDVTMGGVEVRLFLRAV